MKESLCKYKTFAEKWFSRVLQFGQEEVDTEGHCEDAEDLLQRTVTELNCNPGPQIAGRDRPTGKHKGQRPVDIAEH